MRERTNVKKVCSFYVSNIHFATMILPWTHKKIEDEIKIITFFENNLTTNIELVLSNLLIAEDRKKELMNINWKNTIVDKYLNIEKTIKNALVKSEKIIIIINGKEDYINIANEYIEKYIEKNNKKIEQKEIKIINFYEVGSFNENINEILDNHELVFNTSGEHRIEDVFEGYERKEKINV